MAKVFSFSAPDKDQTVQDVLKLIGRTPFSEVVIDSLRLYKNKMILGQETSVDKIPDWKVWKALTLSMPGKDIDESIERLEQLLRITKSVKKFNSGILKVGKDY